MDFFRFDHDIPFIKWRRIETVIPVVKFMLSGFFIATKGLNLGVDFTGGTVLEFSYNQTADLGKIRSILTDLEMSDASVQKILVIHAM